MTFSSTGDICESADTTTDFKGYFLYPFNLNVVIFPN